MAVAPGPSAGMVLPPIGDIHRLAEDLLAGEGTRLAHVRTAGAVASRITALVAAEDAALVVAAANLHDIGYSARIAHCGFHPLDGGRFLVAEGFPRRLAGLVAHHSLAYLHADPAEAEALAEEFPREDSLASDVLAYADMHSAPDGRRIAVEHRLADIAQRHADARQVHRAQQLRIAMTRVGAELLRAPAQPPAAAGGRERWIDWRSASDRTAVRDAPGGGFRTESGPYGRWAAG